MQEEKQQDVWAAVEAEYIEGKKAKEIAEKYGVSASTLYKKAIRQNWKKKREKVRKKADDIVINRRARARAKELTTMCQASAGMARLLERTIATLEEMEPSEVVHELRGVADLAKAIKSNTDALMLLHGIQTPAKEEEQRIARERLKIEQNREKREEMREQEDTGEQEIKLTIVEQKAHEKEQSKKND